jgi:hypothetical protein
MWMDNLASMSDFGYQGPAREGSNGQSAHLSSLQRSAKATFNKGDGSECLPNEELHGASQRRYSSRANAALPSHRFVSLSIGSCP